MKALGLVVSDKNIFESSIFKTYLLTPSMGEQMHPVQNHGESKSLYRFNHTSQKNLPTIVTYNVCLDLKVETQQQQNKNRT